jgi:thiamine biosynthesis lipoprotein
VSLAAADPAVRLTRAGSPRAGTAIPPGMRAWTYPTMGTTLSVLAPTDADQAGPLVEDLFDDWDRRFSRFRPDSELSRINRSAGERVEASRQFRAVARAAVAAAHATNGLFDPTLGARIVALGYDRTFLELPLDRPAMARLAPWSAGAWRSIEIDDAAGTIRMPVGAQLDFGGIAKGMAVDAALDLLEARGIGPVAVDAGGDLAVRGTPPTEEAWAVELADAAGAPTVWITEGALATSSTIRRTWQVGSARHHHLIDPRTGAPTESGLRAVTVVARTARIAEVAAKVALILGLVGGSRFLDGRGLSAVLVDDEGIATPVGSWARDARGAADGRQPA